MRRLTLTNLLPLQRKRLSMSKKEEEETGIDYLSYEEFTRPLSGPEVWDSPEWRAERKASEG